MIDKIQLTAALFSFLSYLIISFTTAENLPSWFMFVVLLVLVLSICVAAVTTLMKIWD